jgi:uncharacterized protein involved in exopolysaccharide biosynthesis
MTVKEPNTTIERVGGEQDEEAGVDFEQMRERVGFLLRAPRRRPKLAAAVFTVVAALGITIAVTMPRTYSAQARLSAQRNLVVPALTRTAPVPREAEEPTKNVANIILRRDNLVSLAKELDLAARFYATRSPALRFKDSLLGGPTTDAERLHMMVGTLEKRLMIGADDNSVTIGVEWSEPRMAYDIVSRIQENFMEARYDDEVSMITDAIAVLQEHAKAELDRLNAALDEYQKLLAEEGPKPVPGLPAAPRAAGAGAARVGWVAASRPAGAASAGRADPELLAALEEKHQQIQALESERQRELDNLKQQLTQAQLTLTPQHPAVQALQQQIEARSRPSPELIQLKSEERTLAAQAAQQAAVPTTVPSSPTTYLPGVPRGTSSSTPTPPLQLPTIPPVPDWDSDGRAKLAHSRLEAAIKSYDEVSGRIEAANIELDIARTAFKYRYAVVTPAEIPRGPKKPIGLLIGVASVLGAVLLAILSAAGADTMRGRILEPWQVRRSLKVEVLGELEG